MAIRERLAGKMNLDSAAVDVRPRGKLLSLAKDVPRDHVVTASGINIHTSRSI
jgi:hypothetical protein